MELTTSFELLLRSFAPVFTQPSFQTFRLLMNGWILSTRHRYVTDLIVSSDSTNNGHFTDYHRFFSKAAWDIDQLWKLLAMLIVRTLIGNDAIIILSGDGCALSQTWLRHLRHRHASRSTELLQVQKDLSLGT